MTDETLHDNSYRCQNHDNVLKMRSDGLWWIHSYHQGTAKITGDVPKTRLLLKLYHTNYRSSVFIVLPLLLIIQAYLPRISSYIKHRNTKNWLFGVADCRTGRIRISPLKFSRYFIGFLSLKHAIGHIISKQVIMATLTIANPPWVLDITTCSSSLRHHVCATWCYQCLPPGKEHWKAYRIVLDNTANSTIASLTFVTSPGSTDLSKLSWHDISKGAASISRSRRRTDPRFFKPRSTISLSRCPRS